MKTDSPVRSTLEMIKNDKSLKAAAASRNNSSLGPGAQKMDDSYQCLVSDPERLADKNMPAISRRLNAKNFKH